MVLKRRVLCLSVGVKVTRDYGIGKACEVDEEVGD